MHLSLCVLNAHTSGKIDINYPRLHNGENNSGILTGTIFGVVSDQTVNKFDVPFLVTLEVYLRPRAMTMY